MSTYVIRDNRTTALMAYKPSPEDEEHIIVFHDESTARSVAQQILGHEDVTPHPAYHILDEQEGARLVREFRGKS